MAFVSPSAAISRSIRGDMRELPIPLLAFTIPETAAALFFGTKGETAPITIPKQTAPVPADRQTPRLSTRSGADRIHAEDMNPAASRRSPV